MTYKAIRTSGLIYIVRMHAHENVDCASRHNKFITGLEESNSTACASTCRLCYIVEQHSESDRHCSCRRAVLTVVRTAGHNSEYLPSLLHHVYVTPVGPMVCVHKQTYRRQYYIMNRNKALKWSPENYAKTSGIKEPR